MTLYDESVLKFVRSTTGDPTGLSQHALMGLYKILEHVQDREMKEELEFMIRRIVRVDDRYRLEVK